jgi:hypothetical protein
MGVRRRFGDQPLRGDCECEKAFPDAHEKDNYPLGDENLRGTRPGNTGQAY